MSALLMALDDADESAEDRKPFEPGSNDALDAALRDIARAGIEWRELLKRLRDTKEDDVEYPFIRMDAGRAAGILLDKIDAAEAEAARG